MTEHEDYNGCYCARCLNESDVTIGGVPFRDCRMILCQVCGNKRCPKATDCRLECTGSNAPGQKGSNYEGFSMAEINGEPALRISKKALSGGIVWTKIPESETLVDAIVRDETRANLDGAPDSRDTAIRQKLSDAMRLNFAAYVKFEERHAIDKKFNPGDRVSVVGVPEVRGVVERIYDSDGSNADCIAIVAGIPDYTRIAFVALEHAPDDDGVTRYHTESGEVFAECGTPTGPCETSDAVDTEEDGDWNERVVMCLEDFIHLVGTQRRLIDSLWVSCLAVSAVAVASLIMNVYLVMGGAK